ncbi:hypothetical protein Zmor_017571 [Zophobas morio]|uniref:Uncharacterized protein n=1 Tax=Zophobas morio TaxID=2755281 RepID=A0AA38ICQ2_9CUCU|nr:hypothetical protein Zmor_017571 [Zophobas morio]
MRQTSSKVTTVGIRIQPISIDYFSGFTRFLEQIKAPYHTFALPEEKTLRVVIRDISIGISSQDVLEESFLNTEDQSIWKMDQALRSDKRPLPPIHR